MQIPLTLLLLLLLLSSFANAADSALDKIKSELVLQCPRAFFEARIDNVAIWSDSGFGEMKNAVASMGVQIRIVSSVAKAVMTLPNHPLRQAVLKNDAIEGWFDQYTTPKLILLQRSTTAMTLFHELRHAYHLGQNDLSLKTGELDRLIQQLDLKSERQSNGGQTLKEIVEIISEIVAYNDEMDLYQACGYEEALRDSGQLQRDYVRQFKSKIKKFRPKPAVEILIKKIVKLLPAIN